VLCAPSPKALLLLLLLTITKAQNEEIRQASNQQI
jgi:hypothetical protein